MGNATYAEPGSGVVTVAVNYADGSNLFTNKTGFSVADAPLTDSYALITFDAVEGISTGSVVMATFTDCDPFATLSDYNTNVDWGGNVIGTPSVAVQFVSSSATASNWEVVGSTTYAEAGHYTPTVTVNDVDGSSVQTKQSSFDVADAALTDSTPPTTISGTEGLANTNVVLMTFSDANPFAPPSDYSVTSLDWGGTLAGTTPTVSIVTDPSYVGAGSGWKVVADTVTYAEKGLYTVSLTVHDDDGSNVSTSQTQFRVADAALTDSTPAATINATAGVASTNVVVMTFVDANPFASAGEYSVTSLDWGGTLAGTAPTVNIVTDPSYVGSGSGWKVVADTVTYAVHGTDTVSLTVHDTDGQNASTNQTKFSVALLAGGDLTDTTPSNTFNAVEGSTTGSVILATFTDGDPAASLADFSASVNWSGTVVGTPSVAVQFVSSSASDSAWEVLGSATFAEKGTYTTIVTINDTDGSRITTTQSSFSVADARAHRQHAANNGRREPKDWPARMSS